MIVKSFEGVNMKDALQAVKNEFGTDAVILSTNEKTLPDSDLKIVEIRAAATEKKGASGASGRTNGTINSSNTELNDKITRLENKLESINSNMVDKSQIQNLEGGIQELKLFVLEALKNKEGSLIEGLPDCLVSLENGLRYTGLDEVHITKLLKHLMSLPSPKKLELSKYEGLEEYYRSQAIKWMFKKIDIAPKWSVEKGSTAVHVFIGPTGSGKTMTIAKIAGLYKKEKNAKVLLICYDNARIAASEQLRIYAKVLGIDFVEMSDAKELPEIILKHRDASLVLIDTAGRCPKVESQLEDLKGLQKHSLPIENHLILPITEKQDQLDKTVRGFSSLGLDSLLFTKLDESWTFGEIFNLSKKWNVPISFFSTGQQFPGDLERSSRERVVERIFGI